MSAIDSQIPTWYVPADADTVKSTSAEFSTTETPKSTTETTTTSTSEITKTSTSETTSDESHYKLVNRVLNYPTVSSALETAKGYYEAAKESSSLVKTVTETVESNMTKTMNALQPVIDRSQPILTSLDNMGCNQLDRLEKLTETYQPTVTAIADGVKSKASAVVETSMNKIEPIDQYLKTSYLAAPIAIAVDSAEHLANRYLPESNDSADESGPIFRSGKLAMRMQKEALHKLQNLTLRDAKTTLGYTYVVDLIHYAATNLDSGVESTTKYVHDSFNKGVEVSKEKARAIIDSPTLQNTREHVQQRSHDAMVAISAAIELISKQIPEPVSNASHQVYDQAKLLSLRLEESNMNVYNTVAAKSAEKLRDMGVSIQTALQNASSAPLSSAVLENARTTLMNILDNLVKIRDAQSVDKAAFTEVQTETRS